MPVPQCGVCGTPEMTLSWMQGLPTAAYHYHYIPLNFPSCSLLLTLPSPLLLFLLGQAGYPQGLTRTTYLCETG